LVRRVLTRAELIPEARAFVVARDGECWRLWMLTPRLLSLTELASDAARRGDTEGLGRAVERAVTEVARLRGSGVLGGGVPGGASALALSSGRLVLLALDEGEGAPAPPPADPIEELRRLATPLEGRR
jgi:hypothetical protein